MPTGERKKIKKVLDKPYKICYNKDVKRKQSKLRKRCRL